MSTYAKAAVAVLGAALLTMQAAITDGVITPTEWVGIALAATTAFGVWLVPNKSKEDGGDGDLGNA